MLAVVLSKVTRIPLRREVGLCPLRVGHIPPSPPDASSWQAIKFSLPKNKARMVASEKKHIFFIFSFPRLFYKILLAGYLI